MMLPFSLGHVYISMLLSIMARSRSASNSRSCWKQSEKTLRSLHPRAGSISYHELFNTLKQRAHNISVDCKRFLTAIAFEGVRDPSESFANAANRLDCESWELKAQNADELRDEIKARLQSLVVNA